VPLAATYRVRIGACAAPRPDEPLALSRETVGTVMIGRERESLAWRGLKALIALVQRESGA
jgi:putative peptide zinc metalloprotease protein